MTFDDLLKAHISRMIAAAAAAQVQTELASRVGGWRSRIGPVLEEEDARPAFDIHVYGQRVLDAMQGLSLREPGAAGGRLWAQSWGCVCACVCVCVCLDDQSWDRALLGYFASAPSAGWGARPPRLHDFECMGE